MNIQIFLNIISFNCNNYVQNIMFIKKWYLFMYLFWSLLKEKSNTSTLISYNFLLVFIRTLHRHKKKSVCVYICEHVKNKDISNLFYKITKNKPQSSSCWHIQILECCAQLRNVMSKLSNRPACICSLKATWWYHIGVWMESRGTFYESSHIYRLTNWKFELSQQQDTTHAGVFNIDNKWNASFSPFSGTARTFTIP